MKPVTTTTGTSDSRSFILPTALRKTLLAVAIICCVGPNGYFLYSYFAEPQMFSAMLANPLAASFVAETAMLLGLFMIFVWHIKRDFRKVAVYYVAAMVGGLAFALPIFIWLNSVDKKVNSSRPSP